VCTRNFAAGVTTYLARGFLLVSARSMALATASGREDRRFGVGQVGLDAAGERDEQVGELKCRSPRDGRTGNLGDQLAHRRVVGVDEILGRPGVDTEQLTGMRRAVAPQPRTGSSLAVSDAVSRSVPPGAPRLAC
jgi:hypothetical protein